MLMITLGSLSGGKIIIYPPKESKFVPEDNILLGNVALMVQQVEKLT